MTDLLAHNQNLRYARTRPAYWTVRSVLVAGFCLLVFASGTDLYAQRGSDRDSRGRDDDRRGPPVGSVGRSGSEGGRPSSGGPGSGGPDFGRGGPSSGRSSFGGFGEFLKRMDSNGDGSLDPAEIPERMEPMIARMTEGSKLDLKRPIKIAALEQAMASARERMMSGRGEDRGSSRSRSGSDSRRGDSKSDTKGGSKKIESTPLVPGFGEPSDLAAVPGFEVAAVEAGSESRDRGSESREREDDSDRGDRYRSDRSETSASSSSTSGSSSRTSSGSSSSAPTDKATRVRQYAGSLFKKYDVDKDGFLNKEEISQNPSVDIAADTNRDGLIAAAEFETHMLSRNGVSSGLSSTGSGSTARSEGSSDGRSRSGRSRDTDSGRSDSRRSRGIPTALAPLATINGQPTRFMTPTERLPEGLPSWFALKDLDADGQISMGEYSKTWSEAKLREYTEIDSNNDGVITPAECLAGSNSEER